MARKCRVVFMLTKSPLPPAVRLFFRLSRDSEALRPDVRNYLLEAIGCEDGDAFIHKLWAHNPTNRNAAAWGMGKTRQRLESRSAK